jgi:hypothetical protein
VVDGKERIKGDDGGVEIESGLDHENNKNSLSDREDNRSG